MESANTRKAWWYLGGASVPDPGFTYLTQNAKQFFDFTTLAGVEDSVIVSVSDLSPNGRNLEGNGNPVIKNNQINSVTYKTAETYVDSNPTRRVLQFANAAHADGMFRSSFEIFASFLLEDGQPSTVQTAYYFGLQAAPTLKNAVWFRQNYGAPNYFLNAVYSQNTPQTTSYGWSTANGNPFVDGAMGQTLVRIKFDFENDIFLLSVNGATGTYTVYTSITAILDATNFTAGSLKFVLGSANINGTIDVQSTIRMNWLRWAVTPILTPQQLSDVVNYIVL